MANQNYDNIKTNQISMYQNDKKLIELLDKLNPAPVIRYAHIHANGEVGVDGRHSYSKIGVVLQDYTDRSKKTRRVNANLDPEEVKYIYSYLAYRCIPGADTFEYTSDKIFGAPDETGKSSVTKMRIARQPLRKDKDGNMVKSKYPWYIEVTTGKATPISTDKGGKYYEGTSFEQTDKIFVNLSDFDMFSLFSKAVSFINVFEQCYGASLISAAFTMNEGGSQ